MQRPLTGVRIAALVASGFEEVELSEPRRALEVAGARVELVSPKKDFVRSWMRTDWGADFAVDRHLGDVEESDYAALLIPGGLLSPDYLRMDERAVALVRRFARAGKPIAAFCHAPWLLIEADVVEGRSVTSFPSLRTDLENAGARWRDAPVVTDRMLLTVRRQDDLDLACPRFAQLLTARASEAYKYPISKGIHP